MEATEGTESALAYATRELDGTSYAPLKHLASGSFGDVFVVRHRDLGTELVLKLLKPEFIAHADVVERLKVEARILTRVTHPNLIRVTDFGWTRRGQPFLVCEKLTGETLQDRLKREKFVPLAEALDIAIQLLEALAVVHDAKLVHRDVKPANLFLAKQADGKIIVKLLDFGIAKILDPAEGASLGRHIKTAEGIIVGTPAYLAPEQIVVRPIDARTDLYAATCVLYRMLSGRTPFLTQTQEELVLAHVRERPSPLSDHAPFPVWPALEDALQKGLAKAPNDRFQTAREFAQTLRGLARPRGAESPGEAPPRPNRGTIPIRANELPAPPAATPSAPAVELPPGLVFRGSDPEDGTMYASHLTPTPGPGLEATTLGPAEALYEDTERIVGATDEAPAPQVQTARPSNLVPALLAVIALLVIAVLVMGALLLR